MRALALITLAVVLLPVLVAHVASPTARACIREYTDEELSDDLVELTPLFLDALDSPAPDLRRAAVERFVRFPAERARDALGDLARDEPRDRIRVDIALAHLRDERALEVALRGAGEGEDGRRAMMLSLLTAWPDSEAASAVLSASASVEGVVGWTALSGLARLGTESADARLLEIARLGPPRAWAVQNALSGASRWDHGIAAEVSALVDLDGFEDESDSDYDLGPDDFIEVDDSEAELESAPGGGDEEPAAAPITPIPRARLSGLEPMRRAPEFAGRWRLRAAPGQREVSCSPGPLFERRDDLRPRIVDGAGIESVIDVIEPEGVVLVYALTADGQSCWFPPERLERADGDRPATRPSARSAARPTPRCGPTDRPAAQDGPFGPDSPRRSWLQSGRGVLADAPRGGAMLPIALVVLAAVSGTLTYDDFSPDAECAACHNGMARQFEQSLMSQCFTHDWDEIEYFELALPHSLKDEKVAGIKAGCNGCHSPLAFLAGDIPPKHPAENTRANEAISCDLCHSIAGFEGDVPFNFNYTIKAGDAVQAPRPGVESPGHEIEVNPFLATAELCGTCHNEKDPYGVWVKSTHLEWKDSRWAKAGIVCQDCHMPPADGNSAPDVGGADHPDVRQHLFHGAHDPGKLAGAVEVRIHPDERRRRPGQTVTLTATVVNAKAGHMIPSGSAEERVVWLDVEATDSAGRVWHLPVDAKGFEGEEMTIASATALAYQDIGDIKGLENFAGLKRDGDVPAGDRIFRLPYLDPQGRMTVAQWNTARLGTDYRLAPLVARNETFTWALPEGIAPGPVSVVATVHYSRLVSSVAEYMKVPEAEYAPALMARHETTFDVAKQ